jgi:MFS transporter, DHA2 family, multidrug resistance protein
MPRSLLRGSLLGQNTHKVHASLSEYIQPFREPMQHLPAMLDPGAATGRAMLDALVTKQAALVAFLGDFYIMFIIAPASLPLVLLMRHPDHKLDDEEITATVE